MLFYVFFFFYQRSVGGGRLWACSYDLDINLKSAKWLKIGPFVRLEFHIRGALQRGVPGQGVLLAEATSPPRASSKVPSLSVLWGGFQNGVQLLCPLGC